MKNKHITFAILIIFIIIIGCFLVFKNSNKSKLLIYIEGEKVKRNEQRGVEKVGPVFIAAQASVPIVPVYVTKNPRLFSKVEINFGDPIYIDKNKIKDKTYLKNRSKQLLDTIYNLNTKK